MFCVVELIVCWFSFCDFYSYYFCWWLVVFGVGIGFVCERGWCDGGWFLFWCFLVDLFWVVWI